MYQLSLQQELFNKPRHERESGAENLITIYKNRLRELFGNRFLENSVTLKNSRNSSLYELMFCVGSDQPKAIHLAKNIAKHLLSL
ncbi:MAG: hypothetical protein OXF08_09920 [Bacteroidetes bacterium]|nr:hypothetical protein [Bacteroidota bacterium]